MGGFVGDLFGSLVGGILTKALAGGVKEPKTSNQAAQDTEADARKAKTARSQLLETGQGLAGAELDPTQIGKKRDTLLGN